VIADWLLTDAAVWDRPYCSALAVAAGRIVALGAGEDLRDLIGPATRVIDLGGRSVLPAFQDAHIHSLAGGISLARCQLTGLFGPDELRAAIADYADQHPSEGWILGLGWEEDMAAEWLDRRFLDAIVPDRPVFLMSAGLHDAWLNSVALQLAGVDSDLPDPPDGRIGRFPNGEPRGLLHEGAVRFAERVAPAMSDAANDAAMLDAQSHLHRLGITAWQDARVEAAELAVYQRLARRGELTARVTCGLWWDRHRGEEQIDGFIASRQESAIGTLRATSVKIMVDGTTANFTASMLEPYLGEDGSPSCNCGMNFVEPEALTSAVTRLDAAGFQVHMHAIGEGAVRNALDAVEVARRVNGWSDLRHHIAHVCLVHPADIGRFATLDVSANIQPFWAAASADIVLEGRYLGDPRSSWWYQFQSIRTAGGRLAGGSDWPVSTADPFSEIHVAVNRTLPGDTIPSFLPHERLSLTEAVRAFTAGAAYVNHLDHATGDLTVGKLADLVVLDRDLMASDPRELADTKVLLTLLGGSPVHEDPRFESAA
jgi:predicted amidohydrolase YtcJ